MLYQGRAFAAGALLLTVLGSKPAVGMDLPPNLRIPVERRDHPLRPSPGETWSRLPAHSSASDEDALWYDGFGLPVANGDVLCAAEFGGGIAIGGRFTLVGDVPAHHVALWDGAHWRALGRGVNDDVVCLSVFQGELIAGGRFSKAGDTEVFGMARWDGVEWSAVPGFNGTPFASAVFKNALVVGGSFAPSAAMPARSLARWDGSSWSLLDGDVHGVVRALAVRGNRLFVGGMFDSVASVAASSIAVYDGSWSALGSGIGRNDLPGSVYALATWGDSLLVGGTFDHAGELATNGAALWNGSAWDSLGFGSNAAVYAMAVHDGVPYAGGYLPLSGMTQWNGTTWVWTPWATVYVAGLLSRGSDLIVCGMFGAYTPGGQPAGFNLVGLSGGTWHPFETWTGRMHGLMAGYGGPGQVVDLAVYRSEVVAAGYFSYVGTSNGWSELWSMAAWDGMAWHPLPDFPGGGYATTLLADGDSLIVGGDFSSYDGGVWHKVPAYAYDGRRWTELGTLSSSIRSLSKFGGRLYAGTSPTDVTSPGGGGVYQWSGAGWDLIGPLQALSEYPGIETIIEHAGELVVGGTFDRIGDVPARNIALWDGSQWHAMGAGPPTSFGGVYSLASHNGQLVASTMYNVWTWDGAQWTAMESRPLPNVLRLASVGGELFAGGYLWWEGDPPHKDGVARWDGTKWIELGSGTDDAVTSFALLGGSTYMGGYFGSAGGRGSFGMARWDGFGTGTSQSPTASLSHGSPNPFRQSTEFTYAVQKEGPVRIAVFDLSGRRVAILADRVMPGGSYSQGWDGRDSKGRSVPSGVYFVRMEHPGGVTEAQKIVRLR